MHGPLDQNTSIIRTACKCQWLWMVAAHSCAHLLIMVSSTSSFLLGSSMLQGRVSTLI